MDPAPPVTVTARALPAAGTLTFLFTDVEGSTRLWERHPEPMRRALTRHDALIEGLVARHSGAVVRPRGEGDSRFAVFARATDAVAAAAASTGPYMPNPGPPRRRYACAWPCTPGDTGGVAVALTLLGDVARVEGNLAAAAPCYQESLALWRDLGVFSARRPTRPTSGKGPSSRTAPSNRCGRRIMAASLPAWASV